MSGIPCAELLGKKNCGKIRPRFPKGIGTFRRSDKVGTRSTCFKGSGTADRIFSFVESCFTYELPIVLVEYTKSAAFVSSIVAPP